MARFSFLDIWLFPSNINFYGFLSDTCFIYQEAAINAPLAGVKKRWCLGRSKKGRLEWLRVSLLDTLRHAKLLIAGLLLLFSCAAQSQDDSGAIPVFELNMPEMNAADALNILAEQTDSILLFPYQDVQSRKTNAIMGRYSLLEALSALLDNTGLEGSLSQNGAIKISLSEPLSHIQEPEGTTSVNKKKSLFAALIGVFAGDAIVTQAVAQDASAPAQQVRSLEEIVITSRRYEESVNDAPVAVNVLSQSFIEDNRIDRADDIFNYTPGATYESFSKLQPTASIRGLVAPTPGNASSESSIQTVIDNVVVTKDFMKGQALFDLSRVEVLRGPQGTAFGRNASVGLLHFVTNRPELGETSGSVTATLGSDERREVDGYFNAPLGDNAAFRIAFNHEQEDGQTEDIQTGDGLDGEENTTIRAQLALEPSDSFSANFKIEYSQDRDESPVRLFCNPGPGGAGAFGLDLAEISGDCDSPFTTDISDENVAGFDPVDFKLDRDILTVTAEFEWALDNGLNITSVTGYMDGDTDNLSDINGTSADVTWQGVTNDGDSLSTELRIDNVGSDSSIQWLAGIYLLEDEETRAETLFFQPRDARGAPFIPTNRVTGGTGETSSWSVFGEVSFDLSDTMTLTYGGRFLNDDKDYVTRASGTTGGFAGQLAGLPLDPVTGERVLEDFPQSESWDDFISKLSLDVAFTDTLNGYALVSQGFKSGAFQPDALNEAQASVIIEPEESLNYELGLKGESGSYRYAVTVFRIELDDVQTQNQIQIGDAFVGLISNVGEVTTNGIEFDGAYAITDNLTISGGFAFLDSEIGGNTPDPSSTIDPATGEIRILDGLRPAGAPEWTVTLAADYLVQLSGGSSLNFRADFRGRDDVWFQTRNRFNVDGTERFELLRPNISDFGARATWTNANEDISVSLWGKNLREDIDVSNVGPAIPGFNDFARGFRGKREYGLTATYDF